MEAIAVSGRWQRLRTLGRGASGAVVSLAADGATGELFAVKSAAAGAATAALLRREQGLQSGLCSPHVVRCIGGGEGKDGSYDLFLEYAPGGSLADEVARNGGRLEERAIRAFAADVLRGLAYLHGEAIVHGDVKARNVVIGADGRAKLADFGCARPARSARPIGGTPAFMAPEVARGEEQGPAADVWALGCTVIEMATGRAPWSGIDDVLAAVHRIGYTEAVPEVPAWLSAEAKDFLARCLARDARDRCTAAQLLEHPFVAFAGHDDKARRVSPKSTLDAAFWDSDSDDEAEATSETAAERIKSLACPASALPDWDCEEGWIDVIGEQGAVHVARSAQSKLSSNATVPAGEAVVGGGGLTSDELDAEVELFLGDARGHDPASVERQHKRHPSSDCDVLSPQLGGVHCNRTSNNAIKFWLPTNFPVLLSVQFRAFILCFCLILCLRDWPRSVPHTLTVTKGENNEHPRHSIAQQQGARTPGFILFMCVCSNPRLLDHETGGGCRSWNRHGRPPASAYTYVRHS